jgi:hypothetical protein
VLLARDKEGVLRQRIEDCVDERMSCY